MNIIGSEINKEEFETYSLRKKLLRFMVISCIAPQSNISMMPLAPNTVELPRGHRPKIGFSIDSIVGEKESGRTKSDSQLANKSRDIRSQRASSTEHSQNSATPSPEPSCSDIAEKDSRDLLQRASREIIKPLAQLHHHHLHHQLLNRSNEQNGSKPPQSRPIPIQDHHPQQLHYPPLHHHMVTRGSHSSSETSSPGIASPTSNIIKKDGKNGGSESNDRVTTSSPTISVSNNPSRSPSPQGNYGTQKSPLSGSPLQRANPIVTPTPISSHITASSGVGPPLFPHPTLGHHGTFPLTGYPMMSLAAAAAAAQVHQHQTHPGLAGWIPPPHSTQHHHPSHPVASHPFYPWFLAKQSRLLPHRFGPGPDLPGFLLQPFRKPKRIRTAFSPSQLLKLEHAFERNHYVVGAERKQLANTLSLSETQVKVWFQNRRTKHKRMQQEEDSVKKSVSGSRNGSDLPSSGSNLSSAISADSSTRNYSEEMSDDEEIVMDEEYSDEEEMEHLRRINATTLME